ncbi:unnamed protein product [Clavelina lepadiformis]|uniref:ZU5 domain-containing protein n=1 Tax=Clavelina lepadiformis TaxID=159417 RepID=A0ABP0GH61_CLALP
MFSHSTRYKNFVRGPIQDRGLTALPGIGKRSAETLRAAGFADAENVFKHFTGMERNESDTVRWWTGLGIEEVYSSRTYRAMQERQENIMSKRQKKKITTDKRSRSRKPVKRPIAKKKYSSSEKETQPEIKKKNPVSALTSNLTPPSVTQDVGERRGVERPNDFTRSFSQTADQYNKGKAHDEDVELNDVASCNDDSSSGYYSESSENESNVMKVEGQNINILESKFSSHYQFGPAEDKEIDDVVLQDYIPIQTSIILGDWPSTVKLGGCEIKFPAGAVDKCTMVAFTLVYVNKNEDKIPRKVSVTPTLTCLPHSEFKKPVSITLPTCYNSFCKEMPVTIVADKDNDWVELHQMRCTSDLITFETKSLSRLKVVANETHIVTKSLLFKLLPSNKGATDHLINCKILDGLADVTDDEPKSFFKFDVKRNQNVALTLQCDSVAFQPEEVKIQWEEVFRENVYISKKINFVTTCDSVALDQIAIKIKDEPNEEIVPTFGLPFPTPCKALPDVSMPDHTDETKLSENSMNTYTPLQTSTIIGDWPSTVKLGGCEIKFPAGAVDKCTMVAFTLTYSDKDDDKDSEEVTVTPILTCLPDMRFKKPVIMTLPSCYNSFEDDMPVTIMTDKGKTWTEFCEEKCTDNWVTFETESFSRKKATANRRNVGEKLMCFKFSRSAKRSADSIIECKIVDGYVDTSDEECFFKLKVNKGEDLKLTFQCENAKVESRVVYSEKIFRESPVILIEFKFIKNNDLSFGAVTFKVKSKTSKKELKNFPFPPKLLLAQDENIDDTIEKIKAMKIEELNVLHASRKHYDDHIGNEEVAVVLHSMTTVQRFKN